MITRTQYLEKVAAFKDTEFVKVITGVRRAGKSAIMTMYRDYLLQNRVDPTQIIYLNFEDLANHHLKSALALNDYLIKQAPSSGKTYFMFDEIQLVEDWQLVINSLRVAFDADITITGSNARMLSGELATMLSGRYVEINVLPLSFSEFLTFKQISADDVGRLPNAFKEYIRFGGFPAVVLSDKSLKDSILSGIHASILLNDVGYRAQIREPTVLKAITAFLAANVGQICSVPNIVKTLTSAKVKSSIPTVTTYLDLLEHAYLFHKAQRFDLRGKAYLRAKDKYFIVDNGLRRMILGGKSAGVGSELENIVYLELLRRGYQVDVGQLDSQTEIDFVARKGGEILYVQVTYQMPENSTRETDNLLHVRDNYKKLLLTQVYDGAPEIDGVPIKNVIDWLLEAD
jgi:predicted AAA+ superfamily ATPase